MLRQITQGSEEWHDFRKGKIGASSSSAILGVSPWRTTFEEWQIITGKVKSAPPSQAMQRGTEREEEARSAYEEQTGTPMFPVCAEHDEYTWMIASLDGLSMDEKTILEIKWPNKGVMQLAREGKAPDYYYCQMQHQMACVPSAEAVDYYVCSDEEKILVRVERDEEYISNLIMTLKSFYEDYILTDTPPPLDESDYREVVNDPDFAEKARAWQQARQALEIAKEEEAIARSNLIDCTDDGNTLGYGVKLTKVYTTRVDYKKAAEEAQVDFGKYRKTQTVSWRISDVSV